MNKTHIYDGNMRLIEAMLVMPTNDLNEDMHSCTHHNVMDISQQFVSLRQVEPLCMK